MKSERRLPWLLAGALLSAACFANVADDEPSALNAVRARGAIEVAVYSEYPPYSFKTADGAPQGIDVDIAQGIAQRLGLNLKVRLISAGESVSDDLRNHLWKGHYLGGGVADVMLHVGYDNAFAQQEDHVILFAPYFHESLAIAYKRNRIPHLDSPVALTEHRIGVAADTMSDSLMSTAYGGALRSSAVRKLSLQDAVTALAASEVDGVMGPLGELQGLLAEHPVPDLAFQPQQPAGQMRTSWDVAAAVKSSGDASLSRAVAQAMADMKSDGSMARAFTNHGVAYVDVRAAY